MNYQEICEKAITVVREVGSYVREVSDNFSRNDVELKSNNSLVSYADKNAEKKLVEGLSKIIEGAGFLTEEDTENTEGNSYKWIIDPIDGTTNFVYGIPAFAISVGLAEDGEIVAGIIYEINRDEMFYAWKDGGAYLNGKKIKVSPNNDLEESLMATGFPHRSEYMDKYMELFQVFMEKTRGVRRIGSASVDMAYVACGRFDAFYEHNLSAWDVAGGIIIVKEAGGTVTDFKGGENYLYGGEIIAGNATQPQVQSILEDIFFT